jgi:preprotein translocase subunit SecE
VARTRTRSLVQAEENPDDEMEVGEEDVEEIQEVVSDRRRRRRDSAEVQEAAPRKDRPAAGARQVKPRSTGSVPLVYRIPVVRTIAEYFHNVFVELRKVTWPTREETTRLTYIVLGVTAFFSITLGALSLFFSWWFQQAFHADSEVIFLAVGVGVAIIAGATYTYFRRLEV